jgi:hypothetical protein
MKAPYRLPLSTAPETYTWTASDSMQMVSALLRTRSETRQITLEGPQEQYVCSHSTSVSHSRVFTI